MNNNLIKAVAKLDSEQVNMELGKEQFLSVTSITTIAKFFGMNLNDIDEEFQKYKEVHHDYNGFCELCDEGKEDEYKLLSDEFEYIEIQKFAEMIVKKVSEKFQERINRL